MKPPQKPISILSRDKIEHYNQLYKEIENNTFWENNSIEITVMSDEVILNHKDLKSIWENTKTDNEKYQIKRIIIEVRDNKLKELKKIKKCSLNDATIEENIKNYDLIGLYYISEISPPIPSKIYFPSNNCIFVYMPNKEIQIFVINSKKVNNKEEFYLTEKKKFNKIDDLLEYYEEYNLIEDIKKPLLNYNYNNFKDILSNINTEWDNILNTTHDFINYHSLFDDYKILIDKNITYKTLKSIWKSETDDKRQQKVKNLILEIRNNKIEEAIQKIWDDTHNFFPPLSHSTKRIVNGLHYDASSVRKFGYYKDIKERYATLDVFGKIYFYNKKKTENGDNIIKLTGLNGYVTSIELLDNKDYNICKPNKLPEWNIDEHSENEHVVIKLNGIFNRKGNLGVMREEQYEIILCILKSDYNKWNVLQNVGNLEDNLSKKKINIIKNLNLYDIKNKGLIEKIEYCINNSVEGHHSKLITCIETSLNKKSYFSKKIFSKKKKGVRFRNNPEIREIEIPSNNTTDTNNNNTSSTTNNTHGGSRSRMKSKNLRLKKHRTKSKKYRSRRKRITKKR
jgi:hypothetical protein